MWKEDGKYPNVIIELLSDSTAQIDQGLKKQIYQDTFRTPEYFWFDPNSLEFQGFALLQGRYEEMPMNEQGWYWSQQLQLFLGIQDRQLRFFTSEGDLLPTPEEAEQQEQQQRVAAEQRAAEADVRADADAARHWPRSFPSRQSVHPLQPASPVAQPDSEVENEPAAHLPHGSAIEHDCLLDAPHLILESSYRAVRLRLGEQYRYREPALARRKLDKQLGHGEQFLLTADRTDQSELHPDYSSVPDRPENAV